MTKFSCPKSKGLFPFEGDCQKFINCWKGIPHVQSCAPGTLFNAASRECDHASKVTCYSTFNQDVFGPFEFTKIRFVPVKYVEPVTTTPKPGGLLYFDQNDTARSSFSPGQIADEMIRPLAPDSGQRMRLRGGAGPWEGYLEVRAGKDRPWGHVCDAPNGWNLQEANVVCRHLGFYR